MIRELAINLYLLAFRIVFSICKLFPMQKKTVFVASFGDNIFRTMQEVQKQTDDQIVVLKTPSCQQAFHGGDYLVRNFETGNLIDWFKGIYHLASAKHIFIDNYFGFLAACRFKAGVRCIQLWHADGAIKQFGLQDPSNAKRTNQALKRFKEVYDHFTDIVVGSEKMAHIFGQSFGATDERMLRTGIPRTDFFFDRAEMDHALEKLRQEFPVIRDKKVMLYAPTFRDHELHAPSIALDMDKLYRTLRHEYVVFLRLHPAVHNAFENKYPGFIYNVSNGFSVNELLLAADLLVTDYSSIPFEYALLNRPMIFYAYDLEDYAAARGFTDSYEEMVPGPIARSTDDVIDIVRTGQFDLEKVRQFAAEWNEYSTGNASENLVQAIYHPERVIQPEPEPEPEKAEQNA